MTKRRTHPASAGLAWGPSPIHQARTPAEWLTIQDHRTAKELFDFIKPNAYSFVARVFDPLLVVLKGANGRDASEKPSSLVQSLRQLAHDHAFPAALMVVFLIAGVTLLMNYLLWSGLPEAADDEDDEAKFSVNTLPNSQALDIVRLSSCPKGHIVSLSLDRTASIWAHDSGRIYQNVTLQTTVTPPKLWPIVASAFTDNGGILALCTDHGQLGLWSVTESQFLAFPSLDFRGHSPVLFAFTTIHSAHGNKLCLIILTSDGYLTEVEAQTGVHQEKQICTSHIVSATLFTCIKKLPHLIYVNRKGEVHILHLTDDGPWTPDLVAGLDLGPPPGTKLSKIKHVYACSSLGIFLVLRSGEVEVVDFQSRAVLHTFETGWVEARSFRALHSARRVCSCGSPAVHSLSLAYTEQDTEHMIMQTFTLDDAPDSLMCLGRSSEKPKSQCQGLERAIETVHCVDPAGVWESTNAQNILGIRKCPSLLTPASSSSAVDTGYFTTVPDSTGTSLKLRAKEGKDGKFFPSSSLDAAVGSQGSLNSPGDFDWEIWALSASGEFLKRPLLDEEDLLADAGQPGLEDQLFVASAGPITRVGKRSVAVGFGNTVKIITLGRESFDGGGNDDDPLSPGIYRNKKGVVRKTQ